MDSDNFMLSPISWMISFVFLHSFLSLHFNLINFCNFQHIDPYFGFIDVLIKASKTFITITVILICSISLIPIVSISLLKLHI